MTDGRQSSGQRVGLLYGLGAYGTWGIVPPLFFPLLKPAGPAEILAHRVVWTAMLMVAVLAVGRRLGDLGKLGVRTWGLLACASALISTNWLIYIHAVNSAHVVDAALGYFVTPLVSVALGAAIFRERLNRGQAAAVGIAVVAVALLAAGEGGQPVIALGLAVSFALYGAVKKVVEADPRVSVAVETAVAAPLALGYLVVLNSAGLSQFTEHGGGYMALMALSGPVTAIPLLFFAAAAQRLPLITLGLLQYLTPSMQMAWGLVVGDEPMSASRWAGFALIWMALAVFTTDSFVRAVHTRRARPGSLHAS
ncbi:MAG: EamA family transporter RarD [Mycobacterium sp.]|nr:EamA family transporter RarD [Mycobacterium sp.]